MKGVFLALAIVVHIAGLIWSPSPNDLSLGCGTNT